MGPPSEFPVARLVLGLGNPGAEYDGTRHNVGFEVVDRVAAALGLAFVSRGRSLVAAGERAGASVLLAKPQTYMNRSGRAARDLLAEHGEATPLLVVCDDFHLPLGRLRCRAGGRDGGQKGLGSILEMLPDRDVPRLRLGIGDPGRAPAEEFVLRPFKRSERAAVEELLERAAAAVADWLEHGDLQRTIQAVNAAPPA